MADDGDKKLSHKEKKAKKREAKRDAELAEIAAETPLDSNFTVSTSAGSDPTIDTNSIKVDQFSISAAWKGVVCEC